MLDETTQYAGVWAVYLRVSTDEQDTNRQRASTQNWLKEHGLRVEVNHIHEDVGWSRSSADRRPEFQRLLRDVAVRRIQHILVDRPDRFGAKDKFQAFHFLYELREAGCSLHTVDNRELTSDDSAASLMAHLDYDHSERELREKSVRVLEGKRELAKQGQWQGGRVPFGFDVVAFTLSVNGGLIAQWRVDLRRTARRLGSRQMDRQRSA